ncbi:hypothetical protein PT974_07265 [Cladobotryum mycophilum]|uniref:DUF7907 domain-containing protein n=1 Tax=Cladobotryum mycophilum TaxID=491253 RepID=A0ABR0SP18_9HYPO
MLFQTVALGLINLATASPAKAPKSVPSTSSNGFNLLVNVTDAALDFNPPVHNTYINSIHVGGGLNLVGAGDKSYARIFYNNGTAEEYRFNTATLVSDGGIPSYPFGLSFQKDQDSTSVSTGRLDMGAGQKGISVSHFPAPFSVVYPGNFAICNEYVEYYRRNMNVLKKADPIIGHDGLPISTIPKGCVPVTLIPECTKLNDLPAGSISSHEHALLVNCYNDAKSLQRN